MILIIREVCLKDPNPVERDTEDRYHKPLESVLQYYVKYVKPSFEDFIAPVGAHWKSLCSVNHSVLTDLGTAVKEIC